VLLLLLLPLLLLLLVAYCVDVDAGVTRRRVRPLRLSPVVCACGEGGGGPGGGIHKNGAASPQQKRVEPPALGFLPREVHNGNKGQGTTAEATRQGTRFAGRMTMVYLTLLAAAHAQVPGYGVPGYPVTYMMNR
jgi:hypothetical protein